MRIRLAFLLCSVLSAQAPAPQPSERQRLLMESITADSMRGDVSFLASDLLEGRETPSRGLDIAAEYIAAQFRGAGLQAAGNDGFFQNAELRVVRPAAGSLTMSIAHDGDSISISPEEVSAVNGFHEAFAAEGLQAVKAPIANAASLTREEVEGKVVLTRFRVSREVPVAQQAEWFSEIARFRNALRPLQPAFVVNVNPSGRGRGRAPAAYVDPQASSKALRSVTVTNQKLSELYESLAPGATPIKVSVEVEDPETSRLEGRNVAGFLPGSDPALKDTYVVISAHYDHVGTRSTGEDRIFNGANDNASGVAGLIELARAFARLEQPLRRSLLFIAYFGEEKGLIGARYYSSHPLFPLERTVANINLEHLGRTDDNQGSQAGKATVTGYQFSDVGPILTRAGEATGYDVYDREGNDVYFDRSDNAPLAAAGVPAHTVAVTFEFPDYHDVGDEWQKLDYTNMESAVETVAIGIMTIADSADAPEWNQEDPRTAEYRRARARTR